jgi:ABC-type spermidine/putrescine transport system permease subunit II
MFLRGSVLVMMLAFVIRFLAVAYHPVDSAMQRISQNHEDAARILGLSGLRLFHRLHWGMLKGGLFTAVLMVFVDVMKEMPITLMLRPFDWDTLSVRIFEMTSEGMWENAATPALALIIAGLLPVIAGSPASVIYLFLQKHHESAASSTSTPRLSGPVPRCTICRSNCNRAKSPVCWDRQAAVKPRRCAALPV